MEKLQKKKSNEKQENSVFIFFLCLGKIRNLNSYQVFKLGTFYCYRYPMEMFITSISLFPLNTFSQPYLQKKKFYGFPRLDINYINFQVGYSCNVGNIERSFMFFKFWVAEKGALGTVRSDKGVRQGDWKLFTIQVGRENSLQFKIKWKI